MTLSKSARETIVYTVGLLASIILLLGLLLIVYIYLV